MRAAAIAVAALALGCETPKPAENNTECATVRDLGKRSLERWMKHNGESPPQDAPISAAADHTASMAKTAREIGAEFAKAAPKRKELAETAEGAKMLGDLAADKLDVMARSVRDLGVKIELAQKLELAANDAIDKLGRDVIKEVGCDGPASPGCADVNARLADLGRPRAPSGFAEAALASKMRADILDAFAKAVEALPPAPPKQAARDDATKRARAASTAFRTLAQALADASIPQDRLALERQEASEAATRLTAELEAAAVLCGGKLPPKPAPTAK